MKSLDDLKRNVALKLIHGGSVNVNVSVSVGASDIDRRVKVERTYSFNGGRASEEAFYEVDDDTSKSGLMDDAVGNLQSCFNSKHYDFEVDENIVKISPREGVSVVDRLFSVR
tara:strand:- start:920 stop:1258 length:339 start_codon:yes stop_codon:yes gene_type:complete